MEGPWPSSTVYNANSDLQGISEQLTRIQRYQEEALQEKDRELEQLRNQLNERNRELSSKENEIRNLERDRYLQQEERALELSSLARRSGGHHHLINPYQRHIGDDSFVGQMAARICNSSSSSLHHIPRQQPLRIMDIICAAVIFVVLFHFYILSRFQAELRPMDDVAYHPQSNPIYAPPEPELEPVKPWESTPPKPIALMDTNDPFIQRRHMCIQAVRERQHKIFQQVLGPNALNILLVDPAYHANVGDHMLTVGELELIQNSLKLPAPDQCYYIQAGGFYEVCTNVIRRSDPEATNKVAMWHAGGNWGDLWRDAQDIRIPSIKTILENGYKLIGLPQSLYYLDEGLKSRDATAIKEKVAVGLNLAEEEYDVQQRRRHLLEEFRWEADSQHEDFEDWGDFLEDAIPLKPVNTSALDSPEGMKLAKSRTVLMWREKESFQEASRLYPFITNMVVPDVAFQLGPYAPIRNHPKELVDIVIFLRQDHESMVDSLRNEETIRTILPRKDMTFKIVDWSDRLNIFGTRDTFFTDTSIQLLSLGKVVVCDRLHAAILAYLAGLPFVYIDQVSGKVTRTLTAAFEETEGCMDGEQAHWARALSLQEALRKASDMIEKHNLNHGHISFLRSLINF